MKAAGAYEKRVYFDISSAESWNSGRLYVLQVYLQCLLGDHRSWHDTHDLFGIFLEYVNILNKG